MKNQNIFPAQLFYSYCHKDAKHRNSMEKSLAQLKRAGLLSDWSDLNILPGQPISTEIRKKMDTTDIMVFLFSQNFINSEECMKEWEYAKCINRTKRLLFPVPIILGKCAWKDVLGANDFKALPNNGKPVSKFANRDDAWHEVYEGIKKILNELRQTFTLKEDFSRNFETTEQLAREKIRLQDIFIFQNLTGNSVLTKKGLIIEENITNEQQLLEMDFILIHGEQMSGKTALARHLFFFLNKMGNAVLYIDLENVARKPKERIFHETYKKQFNGDYHLWKERSEKTLIMDNLSPKPGLIEFIEFAKNYFDKLIVTVSSNIFASYFRDEERLAEFQDLEIQKLTHNQQEQLIRKRLVLTEQNQIISDGYIDQVENKVNSIILSNRIVPRYPFYVLSILQTYEAYMPENLSVTSYGHCYYVLILANLIKSGISKSDDDINTCFNFAEHLAFWIYKRNKEQIVKCFEFNQFLDEYLQQFIISDSILNRLKHSEYGIITPRGEFRVKFMYYYFLGRFLSKNRKEHEAVIENMCENCHETLNHFTILFVIHHTNDDLIIEDIMIRSMCILGDVEPAKLDPQETTRFDSIVKKMNKDVMSRKSVGSERKKVREFRDEHDKLENVENKESERNYPFNDIYRIFKSNEILGQILRNKFGNMTRKKIEEIVETVVDGGLRIVNYLLKDEEEIQYLAIYLKRKMPNSNFDEVKGLLRLLSFVWTMINIEKVVSSINVSEIRKEIRIVVSKNNTPAYDLVGYFSFLDSSERLSEETRNELRRLFRKHNDPFVKKVLSLRTQHYMNTHQSKAEIEQMVCSVLEIPYSAKSRYSRN